SPGLRSSARCRRRGDGGGRAQGPHAARHTGPLRDLAPFASMAETDAQNRNESSAARSGGYPLPGPGPRAGEAALNGGGWFTRMLRFLFGWKPGSIRADLEVVLEAGTGGETGFSPEERAMLKNILGLRERRLEDVMVPRADIVAVQQDIALGD